ncbi:MAG: M42 family metallopeptidase [Clostridiales bacterium]|nr:M42 family metallopeptidase [Clostridiales bacterium]
MQTHILSYLEAILAIDSPTGYCRRADDYMCAELARLGFAPQRLVKGGVCVNLEGAGERLTLAAHMDTLGFMVQRILENGTLQVTPVGGLPAFYALDTNLRVHTREGKMYTGTLRRRNACIHLMTAEERKAEMTYEDNLCVTLDEHVKTAQDTEELGISCGDFVAVEPDYRVTESGYIKSRFLDDKASCAILLSLLREIAEGKITPTRPLSFLFTQYEEIGHGGACGFPVDTRDFLAIDIGCVGPKQHSDERKVTIATKDSRYPYHYEFTNELIAAAKKAGIPHAVDMLLPAYGSDADVALNAGYDIRHALIGPGVVETHGYERTHMDGLEATLALVREII